MYKSACNSKYLHIFAVAILVLALFVNLGKCQDEAGEDDDEEPEKTCQQYLLGLVGKVVPALPKCLTGSNRINLRLRPPLEPLSRAYCIVKCLLSELEVLNEHGSLDEVNALFFFQDNIPPHILPAVVEVAGPCLEMASTLRPKEYYCQSYGPFTQCLVGALLKGLGPWILDCFGSPAMGGLFGMLNFFVPPLPPAPAERRISVSPSANTTLLLKRMKVWRKERLLAAQSGKNFSDIDVHMAGPTMTTTTTTAQPPIITATTTTKPPNPNTLKPSSNYYNDYYNNNYYSSSSGGSNHDYVFAWEELVNLGKQLELYMNQM